MTRQASEPSSSAVATGAGFEMIEQRFKRGILERPVMQCRLATERDFARIAGFVAGQLGSEPEWWTEAVSLHRISEMQKNERAGQGRGKTQNLDIEPAPTLERETLIDDAPGADIHQHLALRPRDLRTLFGYPAIRQDILQHKRTAFPFQTQEGSPVGLIRKMPFDDGHGVPLPPDQTCETGCETETSRECHGYLNSSELTRQRSRIATTEACSFVMTMSRKRQGSIRIHANPSRGITQGRVRR